MRQNTVKMTTAQFAELHGVNRRTLHYYDDIGLFSPCQKGENGYRYYDASQSIVFEYIRMLKELNMSIAEIADYCKHPAPEKFLQIADRKEAEIDLEIRRLKRARNILKTLRRQLRGIRVHIVKILLSPDEEQHRQLLLPRLNIAQCQSSVLYGAGPPAETARPSAQNPPPGH